MSVFNPPHFLRHIGMPTLREFTEAHVLGPHLTLDWTQEEATLPAMVSQANDKQENVDDLRHCSAVR